MDRYHHGDLRQALIDATEALLAERGPDGFSLREVARRAGVSPAAPAHHFGDAAGLLTAVSALAFEGLTQALREGDARGGDDPLARLREQGVGYIGFALRYPGRFRLMFRGAVLREDDPLKQTAGQAFDGARKRRAHRLRRGAGQRAERRAVDGAACAVVRRARLCAPRDRRALRLDGRRRGARGVRRAHGAAGAEMVLRGIVPQPPAPSRRRSSRP